MLIMRAAAQSRPEAAIRALFAAGEQGAWYEPGDLSTLYQDSAGTLPVTAVGQPVGRVLDKSGRGNHASQPTAASRPILQQDSGGRYYLAFDGVDDWLQTGSIDFTGTDKMTVLAGVRKLSDAAVGDVVGSYVSSASNGSFLISAPRTASSNYGFLVRGDAGNSQYSANGFAAPLTSVLAASFDIAGSALAEEVKPRINGAIPELAEASAGPAGGGNFGNLPIYIGRRGGTTLPFNGRLYSLIVRGALSSQAQIEAAERFVNQKTGAY